MKKLGLASIVPLEGIVTALIAAASVSCTDPVRDQQIAALGDETEGGPGPDHRPGQPCLLCHSDGGPASSKPFAIAGTIYASSKPGADGEEDIFVQFKDARGHEPLVPAQSGPSGNFYVPLSDWPNIAFPIRVGLYKVNVDTPPVAVMKSLINREGSCNYCHRPNLDPADLPDGKDEKKHVLQTTTSSAGQIYVP
jgi:hypothetical protein